MTVKPAQADSISNPAAGAVVLWCILAGATTAISLSIDGGNTKGLEFLSCVGAQRLLADLAVLYLIFIVPLFAWRKAQPLRAALSASGAVLLTAAAGLAMLDNLVGLGTWRLAGLIGFIVLSGAAAVAWAEALRSKPAGYYSSAAILGFGAPLAQFLAWEVLRVDVPWLAWLSPFTAWRAVVDSGSWVPWVVFGTALVVGVDLLVMKLRRARP